MIETNWPQIEADYRLGVKTLRVIAGENNLTHGAVNKRAKRDGWVRDLTVKIKAKADQLVSKQAVSNSVSRASETEIIESNAVLQAAIRREQRLDIQQARRMMISLLDELEDGNDKKLNLYQRTVIMGKLADTLKNLVALEREAFGIDSRFEEQKEIVINNDLTEVARRVAFMLQMAVN